MPNTLVEICVDTPEGLATAVEAGADRIELCASLDVGGLTPSAGLMALAADMAVPVYAMIRPRPGDFVFTAGERAVMRADIAAARRAGLAGVVIGASRRDRMLDEAVLADLCEAAAGLGRTLHRAFDLAPDLDRALDTAAALGFERILTSGGRQDAASGVEVLGALVRRAAGRLSIMPGGGIRPGNAADLVRRTGVREVHASAKVPVASDRDMVGWGFGPERAFATDREAVRSLRAALA